MGIVHFLLVDEGRNILSERLVFSLQKSALAQTEVRLDRENYLAREKVDMDIQIKDINGNPMSGNFALAVVDRTDVKPDTVSNIVSTLLLTSDLKGHIESPLSYLQDNRSSSYALDLLMMTQGWRKYNIPEVLKGNVTSALPYNLELGDEVSGKVEGLFSALKEGNISLLALKDSLIGTELTKPDRNGRFVFDKLEYPSGTHYIVQALSKKGSSKVFIELDPYKSFPAPRIGCIPRIEKPHIEENYMAKMDQKYTIENGMRVYNLAEVIVTGRRERVVKTESPFYSVGVSKVLTEEDVKKDILFLHTTSCDVCRVLLSRIMKCVIDLLRSWCCWTMFPKKTLILTCWTWMTSKMFFTPLPLLSVLFTGRLREMVP